MTSRAFLAPLLAIVIGAALFGLADGAVGLFESGLRVRGGAQHAIYFLLCTGYPVLAGLAAGVLVAILLALLRAPRLLDRRGRGFSLALVLLALLAAVLCELLNADLFRGGGIRGRSWRPFVEWGFRLLAGPLVVVAVLGASRALTGPRRRLAGTALLLGGVVLLVANRFYRQQYADVHLQIAVLALAALSAGVFGLVRESRLDPARSTARAVSTVLLAVILAFAAVHAALLTTLARAYAPAESAFGTRAFAVAQFEPLTRRLAAFAGKSRPAAPPAVDVRALMLEIAPQIAGVDPASNAAHATLQQALDKVAPNRRDWNILWIALDTVRADHVSHLGYGRKTTPALDRLAEDAFVFEHAHTAYPTSNYGFCAALTSLAARVNPVYGRRFRPSFQYHEMQALPSLLGKNGRSTAAVTAFNKADVEDPTFFRHLKTGFDVFNPDQTEAASEAPHITRSAIRVLDGRLARDPRPFFLWVHYIDPHDPYIRHPEFDFGQESLDRYDSEISFADHGAGEVIDALKKGGRLESTIIVAFADHGEEFNEHGGRYHNGSVYDEQIHVPLLIRVPGVQGHRVKCPVSLLDLVPTMADLAGVQDPAPRHGRSLVPIMLGKDDAGMAYSEVFVVRHEQPDKNVRTVLIGTKKLIHRVQEDRFELYDLARDPHERDSLVGQGSPDEARLRTILTQWDAAIDRPFGNESGPPLAAQIDGLLDHLTDPAEDIAFNAVTELKKILLSGYGLVQTRVKGDMHEAEIQRIFDRLAEIAPKTKGPIPLRVLWMLSTRRDPKYAPLFQRVAANGDAPGETRLLAAIALADVDDASGLPILQAAMQHALIPNREDVAWALVRLGDPAGLEWYHAELETFRWGRTLRLAVLALPKLKALLPKLPEYADAPPARILRDRVFEELSRHNEVNLALVEGLRGEKDEDSCLILLRLMRCDDESVRLAAGAALKVVMTPEELDKNRAAMDDEMDADSAQLNLQFDLAEQGYRAALAKGGLKNIGLRFRLANDLRFAGRTEGAREVLEEVERIAPVSLDKKLARRRIDQLQWSITNDPGRWKCAVVSATIPEYLGPRAPFMASFRLRNDGTEVWQGGWKVAAAEIAIRFLDPKGAIIQTEMDQSLVNHLPEAGVNPGEEVRVAVVGVAPEKTERGPMTLSFKNRRMQYPNGGIVWREVAPATRETAPTTR